MDDSPWAEGASISSMRTKGEAYASYDLRPSALRLSRIVRTVEKVCSLGSASEADCVELALSTPDSVPAMLSRAPSIGVGAGGGLNGRRRLANSWMDARSSWVGTPSRWVTSDSAWMEEACEMAFLKSISSAVA